jgi:hypothetical protein
LPYRLKNRKEIHELVKEIQKELETFTPVILICGAGPCQDKINGLIDCDECPTDLKSCCDYNLRERLRDTLRDEGCLSSLFEDNEDITYASMDEKIILRKSEIDLVFIFPNSMGSANELGAFAEDKVIRPKLRVLVPHEFHPFYSASDSYLTSAYQELMAYYRHVYAFSLSDNIHPHPIEIASKLTAVYRRRKLLELSENMDNNS